MSQAPWIVAHAKAREHYALARTLEESGLLALLMTDYWDRGRIPAMGPLRRLAGRRHDAIPNAKVATPLLAGQLIYDLRHGTQAGFDRWVASGERFGRWAVRRLEKMPAGAIGGVLGYNCSSLELFELARRRGWKTVHDQVDPGPLWYERRHAAWTAHPEMENEPEMPCAAFTERIDREWALADRIIVNSQHSLESLAAKGVSAEKIRVLPLAYRAKRAGVVREWRGDGPFTVLWAGNVTLVKGFAAFYDCARRLAGPKFRFVCAGGIYLKPEFVRQAAAHIEFLGHVPPMDMNGLYDRAHLLAFPTLSDGFGMVQLEAMSRGIPVVATPHCGKVVEDGVNGFIIPTGNGEALAGAIETAARDAATYSRLSEAALRTAAEKSGADLREKLLEIIRL